MMHGKNNSETENPAAIAKRMSDLILCFPAAALGGVPWQTLVSKYNERHSTRLDISALGYNSPATAVTTLLWEVARPIDSRHAENPLVAVEDCVAMTVQPGAPATWPSIYQALCAIVSENGSREEAEQKEDADRSEAGHAILVSQLKPLLQRYWHCEFDEGSLSYLNEQGKFVRVKKMKHLLQAVLQWRDERVARQTPSCDRDCRK